MDIQKQLDSVERELRTEEFAGAPAYIQSISQAYSSPIEDVWDAVTTADRIERWFLPVSGELRQGGRYQFEGNAGGRILACDPPADGRAEYRVTWEYGGGVTWLTVRLAAVEAGGTRLRLEHAAHTADVPTEMWDVFGPGATGVGWDQGLFGLALHLGAVDGRLDPSEAQAWQLSEEGKAFTRGAAEGWARAHVASGADPAVAAQAADATYGFYTGEQ
ncbi:SRPBCC domain-containing protein [Microbacterium sp. CIAB417]|uniref:SRPBCC domain-containing protein n=1 Tax=Microbacterium sp. CIAB417 TaxID=2860287 RepID=UPI001FAD49A9|nr:SRPBCC domain-containing protein [Microbacterium sp. CIAB417]